MKAANILWKTASVITFVYGILHIYGTLFSADLHPDNEQVMNAMKTTGLVMGEQHNLWNAWIGFNLNFGLFLLFAGFVGWYLAWKHFDVLKNSQALLLGITLCHGFSVLIAMFRGIPRDSLRARSLYHSKP